MKKPESAEYISQYQMVKNELIKIHHKGWPITIKARNINIGLSNRLIGQILKDICENDVDIMLERTSPPNNNSVKRYQIKKILINNKDTYCSSQLQENVYS